MSLTDAVSFLARCIRAECLARELGRLPKIDMEYLNQIADQEDAMPKTTGTRTKTLTIVVETEMTDAELRRRIFKGCEFFSDTASSAVRIGDIQRLVGIDRHEASGKARKSRAKTGRKAR